MTQPLAKAGNSPWPPIYTFFLYLPRQEAFHHREKYSFPPVAMALSD